LLKQAIDKEGIVLKISMYLEDLLQIKIPFIGIEPMEYRFWRTITMYYKIYDLGSVKPYY
jgi:hypothetical protein